MGIRKMELTAIIADQLPHLKFCPAGKERESAMEDERFKYYRKKNLQPMRPYIDGEDLTGISVNAEDTPEVGGMIAINPHNENDKWYVGKEFLESNYELAEPSV